MAEGTLVSTDQKKTPLCLFMMQTAPRQVSPRLSRHHVAGR